MNYISTGRTNYFRVKDEKKFQKIVNGLRGEDLHIECTKEGVYVIYGSNGFEYVPLPSEDKEFLEKYEQLNGEVYDKDGNPITKENIDDFSEIYDKNGNAVYDDCDYGEVDEFYEGLQTVLPDDEVFVYMEAGNEGYRYVTGYAVLVSNREIKYVSLDDAIKTEAKKMIRDKIEKLQLDY